MIKKIIFGIILSGMLIVPAFADDCGNCTGDGDCSKEAASGHHEVVMCTMAPANPLDAEAREFVEWEVERIAILPFSDYSALSPVKSDSRTYWASRRIHDFMTAEFLKIGKLVVPYDTMVAALTEIRGEKASELTGMAFLQEQMSSLSMSSMTQQTIADVMTKGGQVGASSGVTSLDLTSGEIILLGQALNVDAIFMGTISDYGTDEYIKADARTFIPPFLGVWNPTKKSMIRMLVYLYETDEGELIWSAMEETSYEPKFPLFSNDNKNYEKLNRSLAASIVNHFRDVFVEMTIPNRFKPSPTGGPGDVRREKDIRIIMKEE